MWCCLFKHPSSSTCIAVPRLCEHLLYMGTPTCVCTRCTVRLFGVDIWMVCDVFYGVFPHTMSELMSLPPPPDTLRDVAPGGRSSSLVPAGLQRHCSRSPTQSLLAPTARCTFWTGLTSSRWRHPLKCRYCRSSVFCT